MIGSLSPTEIVVYIVSLVIGLSAHEAMHGYMAHWLGDPTAEEAGRLTLNPLAHVDLYTTILLPTFMILIGLPPLLVARPVPFNPNLVKWHEYGAALVGFVGPLTNILIAGAVSLLVRIISPSLTVNTFEYLAIFVQINIMMFVINMIPIPPLDGSRVLYAFAPEPVRRVMEQIESYGFVAIMAIFLLIFFVFRNNIIGIEDHLLNLLLG